MRLLLTLVLLLGAAACVRDPDPFEFVEPTLSVHGLVQAADSAVYVSFLPGELHPGIPAGASVTLESGGVTVTLREIPADSAQRCWEVFVGQPQPPAGHRCFGARLAQPVAAGSRWSLVASVTPGETVTGTTEVPAPPAILRPAPRERVAVTPLGDDNQFEVEWQTAAAPRVEIRMTEGRAYRGGQVLAGVRCLLPTWDVSAAVGRPSGSRRVAIQDVYCFDEGQPPGTLVAWDSVAVAVVVTAYDPAYAEFALHGRSTTRRPNAALQGAYGVFGSAASAAREIVIVPAP